MSKRKRRGGSRPSRTPRHREPPADVSGFLRRAENLLNHDRAQDAIRLLDPLLALHANVADLHYYLGYARAQTGDLWGGVAEYQRGMELGPDSPQWLPLAFLYLELGLTGHALHALRQVLRYQPGSPSTDRVRSEMAVLKQEIREIAADLRLPPGQVEKGMHFSEEGQLAIKRQDYPSAIAANRRAIQFLGDWPPPRNNLSLALFLDGQAEEAVAEAMNVLDRDPDNIQALSNAIRFLNWAGRMEDGQALWARLRSNLPEEGDLRLKAAEAAATVGDDEAVYELLLPLEELNEIRPNEPGLVQRARFFLAVAEANLGKRSARRRLESLSSTVPIAGRMLEALKEGRPGLGWAERFPYFSFAEFVSIETLEAFVQLIVKEDGMPRSLFDQEVKRFAQHFTQFVPVAERLIWEEMRPAIGIAMLAAIATPAAHAALLRFGLSQAGEDEDRMQALIRLHEAGAIPQNETLRLWRHGKWRDVQLGQLTISDEPDSTYSPEVKRLLDEGVAAFNAQKYETAMRLLQRALKLDPNAKQAYNNLATIYARRGEHDRARDLWRSALEIDPLYVFPRCNLAIYDLDDGDVDGAVEMLKPLASVTHFHSQDMAFYSYVQARILIAQEEYEAAVNALEQALEVWPGYELAEELLQRLRTYFDLRGSWDSWFERQRKRDRAWRARLQAKLTTRDPSLSEALPLYSKDALTAMARVAIFSAGWSSLRKAELIERILGQLGDPDNVERIVADLENEDRDALQQVMMQDGTMPWNEFDAQYGNDLADSRFWNWHEPKTVMGRLRKSGLLVETTVDGEVLIAVPVELRPILGNLFV